MAQPVRRRRRRRTNYTGIIVILLAVILAGLIVLLLLLGKNDKKPDTGSNTTTTGENISSDNTSENLNTSDETTEESTGETTEETTEESTGETTEETLNEPSADTTLGGMIARIAKSQVGKPYKYGGQGPNEFDASGFIQYCFKNANLEAPRLVPGQAEFGTEVSIENIAPGDVIVFWTDGYPDEAAYCAIYTGDQAFVYCSSSKGGVVENTLNNTYMLEHVFSVRRYY